MKRDNSSPIFDNLNSWTDTLNPQKALKGSKKWPTAPYLKLYSLRPIQIRYPEQDLPSNWKSVVENVFSTPTPKNS